MYTLFTVFFIAIDGLVYFRNKTWPDAKYVRIKNTKRQLENFTNIHP